jgi:hypothetical protein
LPNTGQSFTDWRVGQPAQGSHKGTAMERDLSPELLAEVTAAILDPHGPGSVMVHRWLTEDQGIDITYGAVEYYFAKVRRGAVAG